MTVVPYRRRAKLVFSDKMLFGDGTIYQIKVWSVDCPVPPSGHRYKYSLYFGYPGERIVAYDNERGKGDHKHILGEEYPYAFVSLAQLIDDFGGDVERVTGRRL